MIQAEEEAWDEAVAVAEIKAARLAPEAIVYVQNVVQKFHINKGLSVQHLNVLNVGKL